MTSSFDLDALDPDWKLAYKHGISSLPGLPLSKDQQSAQFCQCCNNQICEQDVPLCDNSKTLQFLGFGFPLYFIFIKFALILTFMLLITYTINGIYWANKNNYSFCYDQQQKRLQNSVVVQCTSWMVMLARIEETLSEDQKLLRVTSFVVQLFILLYMRDILRKTNQYYDQKQISPSDFSILVENLPKVKGIGSKIKEFLKDKSIFRKSYQIQAIVFISSLDSYFELKNKKKQLVEQLKNLLQAQMKNKQQNSLLAQIKSVQNQIKEAQNELTQQEQLETQLMKKDEALCEKLILIINTQKQKEEIIQDFESAEKKIAAQFFGQHGSQIKFKEAPEPKEILWENINFSKAEQARRVFISWVIYVSILTVITIVFFFLLSFKAIQVQHSGHQTGIGIDILVFSCLFSVLIFNKFILSLISRKLTDYQKQKTGGELQFSFALKQIIGLFFTTALMTLLVEDLRFKNIYAHSYGVIEEETIIFMMNGFIAPLIWIINPWHIYKIIKKKYYYGSKLITQDQANKLMELTHYSIGKRYAQIIEGLWFTFLYSSVIPLGSFFNLFGLAMFYWIDKYNLLRKSSVLQNVSSNICLQAMTFLDFSLVLKPLGEIIFDYQLRESVWTGSYVCLAIGIIYMFLPINSVLDYFHSENFDLADQTYSETKQNFLFDYKTLHPLKYCLQKEKPKDFVLEKEANQQNIPLKLIMTSGPRTSRGYVFRKQLPFNNSKRKFQQIHSSRDSRELAECGSSANCMVKSGRKLPPLEDARKWEHHKLFL